jgi:acetyl esterase
MLEELDLEPTAARDVLAERATNAIAWPELWGKCDPIARVETIAAAGVTPRMRWYHPDNAAGTVLYMHGGGWMFGGLDTHDGVCRMLANRSGCDVVAVEYRLAPEHPFPAASLDCAAALDWLRSNGAAEGIDNSRIVLCGDSAGGNLAASLARRARDRGIRLAGQVLLYPAVDSDVGRASYTLFESGFFLAADDVRWMLAQYVQAGDPTHPDVAPLRAVDLSGMPPCYLATADHDPLRDEGRAYAMRLIEAGNDVTFEEWRGVVHGFWVMRSKTAATAELVGRVGEWIARRIAASD